MADGQKLDIAAGDDGRAPARTVCVAGAAMTTFGKGRALRSTAGEAVREAIADAGLDGSEVERIYFGNGAAGLVTGQEMVRGQVALVEPALSGIPLFNVENACASGSSAVMLAFEAVSAGRCEIALAVGAEQLWHEDRQRTLTALRGATDLGDPAGPRESEKSSVFMDVYAGEAKQYLAEYGATIEDLALVAVKNREHASLNPKAHYRKPQSVEEVIGSRVVADPLTLPMCSPISDGAAAIVLCSEDRSRVLGRSSVQIRAIAMARGRGAGSHPVREAATAAYEAASAGPEDLDLVELHDAAVSAELGQYAEIGLCDDGEGHHLLRRGAFSLGGQIPVNTSGGLLSRGHPLGATGCAQIVEIVDQLRGRGEARQVNGALTGLAVNGGGWIAGSYVLAVATVLVGGTK